MGRVAGRDCLNRQFHLREWRYDRTDLDKHRPTRPCSISITNSLLSRVYPPSVIMILSLLVILIHFLSSHTFISSLLPLPFSRVACFSPHMLASYIPTCCCCCLPVFLLLFHSFMTSHVFDVFDVRSLINSCLFIWGG